MPDEIVQLCLQTYGLWRPGAVVAIFILGFALGIANEVLRSKRREKRRG